MSIKWIKAKEIVVSNIIITNLSEDDKLRLNMY